MLAVSPFYVSAGNISADIARETANNFIKSHAGASSLSLRAPAMNDIILAHAEPSDRVEQANVYYVFNIKGGGFVIVSGEDHAVPVLGYSDRGQVDFDNLSEPLRGMLDCYKAEIEFLLTHDIDSPKSFSHSFKSASTIVEPMTKSTWGPEEPYYNQCPVYIVVNCKAGCVGMCMAQLLYFWQYPVSSDSLPSYWSPRLNDYIPALPPATFDYSKMLPSYSHWDFDKDQVVQDVYTEEQAQEVSKLVRYCGQSVKMDYSMDLSTPLGVLLTAMQDYGYNSNSKVLYRDNYDEEEWIDIMCDELDAGRPIMYLGYGAGAAAVGHAFIVDGYNSDNYFHMNMGWYGVNDGWYRLSAISFINRYYQAITYDRRFSMYVDMEPPLFCTVNTEINASDNLLVLGNTFCPQAVDVYLSMSYLALPFMFSLTDAGGNEVAVSEAVTLDRLTFEQGSTISLELMLPDSLPEGEYDLHLNYRAEDSQPLCRVATSVGQLAVAGKLAKFGAPFDIGDVTLAIDCIIDKKPYDNIDIGDLMMLIDYIINNC